MFFFNLHLFHRPFEDSAVVRGAERYCPGAGSSAPGGRGAAGSSGCSWGESGLLSQMPGKGDRHHLTPQASPLPPPPPHLAPRARRRRVLFWCTCSSCSHRARRCPALSCVVPSAERPCIPAHSSMEPAGRCTRTHPQPHHHPLAVWVSAPVHVEGTHVGPHPLSLSSPQGLACGGS